MFQYDTIRYNTIQHTIIIYMRLKADGVASLICRTQPKKTKRVMKQVSAADDEPAQSQQTCCKQRWTFSVINLRLN